MRQWDRALHGKTQTREKNLGNSRKVCLGNESFKNSISTPT